MSNTSFLALLVYLFLISVTSTAAPQADTGKVFATIVCSELKMYDEATHKERLVEESRLKLCERCAVLCIWNNADTCTSESNAHGQQHKTEQLEDHYLSTGNRPSFESRVEARIDRFTGDFFYQEYWLSNGEPRMHVRGQCILAPSREPLF
jgi:hypothetical protein